MPKSLVLGNGNILIGLDKFAQVKDFYFPYVGMENQVGGHQVHKIGVWVDGKFSWIDDGTWEIKIGYAFETLVGQTEAINHNLRIKLEFLDTVYNETDIFVREVTVYNLDEAPRTIKLFFHQKFEIYESRRGDTAYYDPVKHAIIHYKGRRVFLINMASDFDSFDDFSIGNFSIEGKEGTFKDAEDGELEKNPIEHGLVDSVVGFSMQLKSLESKRVYYWIAAARLIDEAKHLNDYILAKTPQHIIKTTGDFWRAWVNKEPLNFCKLDKGIVDLFKKSLLIIRTHIDNKGAILASGDSDMLQHGKDNYSYMWPRDGALVATTLDKAGDNNVAKRFFEFCNHVISEEGYFMHKFLTDESLGSSWHPWVRNGQIELPIQEDETALVLIALRQHFEISKDLEFIESIYNSMIKKAAEFMVLFKNDKTNLPKPSYDLWEEKFGVHTFTAASVYGALIAASEFATMLSKSDAAAIYCQTAEQIKEAILKYLWDEKEGYFYKMIVFKDGGFEVDRTVDSSSAYGVFKFNVLSVDDERLTRSFKKMEEKLTINSQVGGLTRYEGDYYYRVSYDFPGNPWFITSLWMAQYQIASARSEEDLKPAFDWLKWVEKNALFSGVMSEQLNPITGEQISASPLTWSHSEFVSTVLQYLKKMENLGVCG